MSSKTSAGLLLYRHKPKLQVLLVHPGGPFWVRKDAGAWSIPKGEYDAAHEQPLLCAQRELREETGWQLPAQTDFIELGVVKLKSGKQITAWAVEYDVDPSSLFSNDFELEWPPRSGRKQRFAEVDRAEWFDIASAAEKINPAQADFLLRLRQHIR